MLNTKDYSKTTERLQSLVDKLGKSKVIKALSTNYRQVQAILDSKKKFVSKKVIDKIDNLYAEVYNGGIETWESGKAILVADKDINKSSDEIFKKYIKKAEDKITSVYANKKYNSKVLKLYKRIDRLWSVIFVLCMFLIILSGMIINLA
jgi:GTP:adenosylcobinamide-phosphate guanylyltransferase